MVDYDDFPITAVVLAGGLGTRLRALINDRPKVLAPVAGKPFLGYILACLAQQGIRLVILSTGYLAEQIESFAGDGKDWGLTITYSVESQPLGTAGGLYLASRGLGRPFFALNGDTFFAADLTVLWKIHRQSGALATLALLKVETGHNRGCVTLDPGGRILRFDEKPVQAKDVLINAGVYVIDPQALSRLPDGEAVSLERQVFPTLAARGQLGGCVQTGYFADIGTPGSLAAFEKDVLAGAIGYKL